MKQPNTNRWLRCTLAPEQEERDAWIGALSQLGAIGLEETATELIAYFVPRPVSELEAQLATRYPRLKPKGKLHAEIVLREDWQSNWRQHFHAITVGNVHIYPSWEKPSADTPVAIAILPGTAFGTGNHATTQIALLLLQKHLRPGMRVLDAGCGSGILTIAALQLGADAVESRDIDPMVESNFRDHMELNHISGRYSLRIDDVTARSEFAFDLIVSNIELKTNLKLLTAIHRSAARTMGIFTGILTDQEDEFPAGQAAGLHANGANAQGGVERCGFGYPGIDG